MRYVVPGIESSLARFDRLCGIVFQIAVAQFWIEAGSDIEKIMSDGRQDKLD